MKHNMTRHIEWRYYHIIIIINIPQFNKSFLESGRQGFPSESVSKSSLNKTFPFFREELSIIILADKFFIFSSYIDTLYKADFS